MNASEKKEHIYENWDLAQRIEGSTRWEDLNNWPPDVLDILSKLLKDYKTFKNSKQVDQIKINPITLFTGSAEKEKSMAAETLANQLDLDLYRIDLSNLIGKYIGETEKN
jgi:SpoVK/Ycf46/Vps4 family AAA+-type ATPase